MLTARKYLGGGCWLCDCDCGNTDIIVRSTLLNEVPGRNKQKSCGCLRNKNRPEKENYFSIIDTANKAYFLGLLAADGTVYEGKIKIDLNTEDEDVLIKFQKEIGHENKLSHYSQEGIIFKGSDKVYTSDYKRLVISSHIMDKDLMKYGIVPNKTDRLDINLDLIPNEFMYDFLRGMIDGDGCISFNENSKTNYADLTLTTSTIMANKIKDWLDKNCPYEDHFVLTHRRKENQDNATLISTTKSYIKNILNLLYGNAEVYMNRKYNKYLAFLEAFGL